MGKTLRKAFYHFGAFSALQDSKCFSFCLVKFAFKGDFLTFPPPPRLCPFLRQQGGWQEHSRNLLASTRFSYFLFPLCNLLKILLTLEILRCFIFPWPSWTHSGVQAVSLKPQKAKMKRKEFATRKGGKLPPSSGMFAVRSSGKKTKKVRERKWENNSTFESQ